LLPGTATSLRIFMKASQMRHRQHANVALVAFGVTLGMPVTAVAVNAAPSEPPSSTKIPEKTPAKVPAKSPAKSLAKSPAKSQCAMDPSVRGEVRAIDERLDVTLTDGTVLVLAGIDPPAPTRTEPVLDQIARTRLSNWLVGHEIRFRALDGRKDRWGRVPALVFAEAPGTAGTSWLSVSTAILDAGFGRLEPSKIVRPCLTDFRFAEAAARKAKLGLWADPSYAVIAASDRNALVDRSGRFVVVEGEPIGVEAARFRTTLWFGPRRGWDFSVTIAQRNVAIFDEAGLDLGSLRGKMIRVRGLLDTRFGPQIEISSPDELEIVSEGSKASANRDDLRR
jgi:endonuclease YncB( thermonuclease family)